VADTFTLEVTNTGLTHSGSGSISGLGTLEITAGGISNDGTLTLDVATLTYTDGALDNNGTLTVGTDVIVPTGSGVTNSGTITVVNGFTLEVTDTGFTQDGDGAISGAGTLEITDDGLTVDVGTTLNLNVATLIITAGGIINNGTLTIDVANPTIVAGLVNNKGILYVNNDLSVPAGLTSNALAGGLTVAANKTLNVTGVFANTAGTTSIAGTLVLPVAAHTNAGTITVSGSGVLTAGTKFIGAGTIAVVGSAAKVTDGTFLVGDLGSAIFKPAAGGTFTYGTASYNVAGPVTLAANGSGVATFTLVANGELTINATLALAANQVTGTLGAKIIIGTGSITTTASNYYPLTNGAALTPPTTGTYNWDDDADGANNSGWRKTA
jgi:filamentous hemagglutinin